MCVCVSPSLSGFLSLFDAFNSEMLMTHFTLLRPLANPFLIGFSKVPSPLHSSLLWNKKKKATIMYSSTTEPEPEDDDILSKKKCVPCHSPDLRPMSEESARLLAEKVPGWELNKEDNGCLKLSRSWKAKTFLKGLEFFKVIGDVAEAEGHHPNLHLVNWNDVRVDIWTHAVGGLTENDFILAAKISDLNVQGLLRNRVAGVSSSTVTS